MRNIIVMWYIYPSNHLPFFPNDKHCNSLSAVRDDLGGEAAMGSRGTQLVRKKSTDISPLLSLLRLILADRITHLVSSMELRSTLDGGKKHTCDEE